MFSGNMSVPNKQVYVCVPVSGVPGTPFLYEWVPYHFGWVFFFFGWVPPHPPPPPPPEVSWSLLDSGCPVVCRWQICIKWCRRQDHTHVLWLGTLPLWRGSFLMVGFQPPLGGILVTLILRLPSGIPTKKYMQWLRRQDHKCVRANISQQVLQHQMMTHKITNKGHMITGKQLSRGATLNCLQNEGPITIREGPDKLAIIR